MRRTDHALDHEAATLLLPWLVNDSLEPDERTAVLEHARSCVTCRRDLEELQGMRERMLAGSDTPLDLRPPSAQRIEAVMRAGRQSSVERVLSRTRRRRPASASGAAGWWRDVVAAARARAGELLEQPGRNLVIAQSVVVVLLAAALTAVLFLPREEQAVYTTLMESEALPSGRFIRVVAHPDATAATMAEIFGRHELEIVAGPNARGVYTLRPGSPGDWERAVNALEDEAQVLFVQGLAVEGQ